MKIKQSNNSATVADAVKIANQRALQPFNLKWENDTVFKKRELNYKTEAAFQRDLQAGKISKYTTVFIKDSKKIYKNGTYYGNSGSSGGESFDPNTSQLTGFTESTLTNNQLEIQPTDSVNTAFGKLQKAVKDDEEVLSAALTKLKTSIGLTENLDCEFINQIILDSKSITEAIEKIADKLESKQEVLVSGTNIKTINGESILGEGDLIISGNGGVGKVDTNSGGTGEIFNHYDRNKATGAFSHSEGYMTTASGSRSHAEGSDTTSSGFKSHAEGYFTTADGEVSHAEGSKTKASGDYSHSEGIETNATGQASHAEGKGSVAYGDQSHAAGFQSIAVGNYAMALGGGAVSKSSDLYTKTKSEILSEYSNDWRTVEDSFHMAYGKGSTVTGKNNLALGNYSFAGGYGNVSIRDYQYTVGRFNSYDSQDSDKLFVVGNGTSDDNRSNAFVVNVTGVSNSSDIKLKENIKDLTPKGNLRLVEFDWKSNGKHSYGFIAQEVEQVYPEMVLTDGDYKMVNYNEALCAKIAELEYRIKQLEENNK